MHQSDGGPSQHPSPGTHDLAPHSYSYSNLGVYPSMVAYGLGHGSS